MNIKSDFDYIAKIALLGDSSVGKTNLVLRFTENTFTVNIPPTIGYDYKSKTIILNKSKKKAKLQIWDTAGQERYMSLCKTVFQRVDGVMLVYDITQLITFENILKWINIIRDYNDLMPIILIGNKIDKINERLVTFENGEKLAAENNIKFMETSALTGENVDDAFINFGNDIINFLKNKTCLMSDKFSLAKNKTKVKKKKKCC
jgi:small GTP-binding protein